LHLEQSEPIIRIKKAFVDDLNVSKIAQIDLLNTQRNMLCASFQEYPLLLSEHRVYGWNTPQSEVECNTYIPDVCKLK